MVELSIRIVLAGEEIDRLIDDRGKIYPICSCCKKVREKTGSWVSVEKYVRDISGAEASHGICPECYRRELDRCKAGRTITCTFRRHPEYSCNCSS